MVRQEIECGCQGGDDKNGLRYGDKNGTHRSILMRDATRQRMAAASWTNPFKAGQPLGFRNWLLCLLTWPDAEAVHTMPC